MTINKIAHQWYQAREVKNGRVYWGYGKDLEEAVADCVRDMDLKNQKVGI